MNSAVETHTGDPAEDPRGFRQCLGQFSTGVTVVTTDIGGQRAGVTANSFSSLSLDPALILWSIAKSSRSYEMFCNARHFAISILAADQVQVSQRFASKEDDKFATIDWFAGENGAPLIKGSAGRLECTTESIHDGGDHALIIGRVTRFEREARKALIFSRGRYTIGFDHPVLRTDTEKPDAMKAAATSALGSLVFKAHLASSHSFDRERAALGLSGGEGRVLYVLSEHRSLPIDALVRHTNLPTQTVEDALSDLLAKGGVERDAQGNVGLTETGRRLRFSVRERSEAREAELLRQISPDRVDAAKQVLSEFIAYTTQANAVDSNVAG